MARLIHNITGPFKGKIGNIVGASWKGIPYLRSAPGGRTKRISAAEKTNREKFALAQSWLQPLLDFVREGFKGYSPTVEGFSAAKSFLMKNALAVTSKGIVIDPAKMQVSFGDLPLPEGITIKKTADKQLIFSWDPATAAGTNPQDQCLLLAYDVNNSEAIMKLNGQFRGMGTDSLQLDSRKRRYQVWLAFVSADRSRRSHSIYLGEMATP